MKIASITHCSALKAIPSQIAPNGMSGGQASIASDWLSKVEKVRPEVPAANVYTGRGYKTLLSRIGNVGGLYVVSAGLGLIPSDRAVPGYDLTIAVGYETSLDAICDDKPDLPDWWRSVCTTRYSEPSITAISQRSDYLLVSLTANYLKMVREDLQKAACPVVLFTAESNSLRDLGKQIIRAPYTSAFDGPNGPDRGTKSDFAQRTHADFLQRLSKGITPEDAISSVAEDMREWAPQKKLNNQKFGDAEIIRLIKKHRADFTAIGTMHRFFRHELNVACEQKRFTKLVRQVSES